MWQAFKDAATEALGSKKFLVLLGSVGAWIALKLGWHVDEATIETYLKFVLTPYLVGQGIADHGKGAAQVAARAAMRMSTMQPAQLAAVPQKPNGFIRLSIAVVMAIVTAAVLAASFISTGCAHPGAATLAAGQCVLDTGIFATVLADLAQSNYADLIAAAVTKAPDLVKCALQAIAVGNAPSGSATTSEPTPVQLRAREMLAKHYGGAK